MSEPRAIHYRGRRAPAEVTDSIGAAVDVRVLDATLRDADAIVIEDPLSFPWDSIEWRTLSAPIAIALTDESLLDLAALVPIFEELMPGDAIAAADPAIDAFLGDRFARTPDEADAATIEAARETKAISMARRDIVTRLRHEAAERGDDVCELGADPLPHSVSVATTIIVDVPIDAFGTNDVVAAVRSVAPSLAPGHPIGVWGVRPAPGATTAAGVVVWRSLPEAA